MLILLTLCQLPLMSRPDRGPAIMPQRICYVSYAYTLPEALARHVVPALPALHAGISPPSSLLTASLGRRPGRARERRPRLPSRSCKRRRLSRASSSSCAAHSPVTRSPMSLRPAAALPPVAAAALSAPDAFTASADAIAPSLAPDVPAPRLSFDPGD